MFKNTEKLVELTESLIINIKAKLTAELEIYQENYPHETVSDRPPYQHENIITTASIYKCNEDFIENFDIDNFIAEIGEYEDVCVSLKSLVKHIVEIEVCNGV